MERKIINNNESTSVSIEKTMVIYEALAWAVL